MDPDQQRLKRQNLGSDITSERSFLVNNAINLRASKFIKPATGAYGLEVYPKVMIVIPALEITGPAKGVFQLLEYLKDRRGEFYLYNFRIPGENERKDLFLKEANKIGLNVNYFIQKKRYDLSIFLQAKREAFAKGINIVQTHGFKPAAIGVYLKHRLKCRWVSFMHGTTKKDIKLRIYDELDKFIQLLADRVILVSETQRKKIWRGYNRETIHIVRNAIDLRSPVKVSGDGEQAAAKFVSGPGNRLAVCVARFSHEKGLDIFVKSMAVLRDKFPHVVKGLLVGDGQLKGVIENLIQELGMQDRILTTGYSEYPGDFMRIADLIVLPSRSEGIPNVILEAMALGKPVVATDVGGVREIIEDGVDGLIVKHEDPVALSDAMMLVLSNRKMAAELGAHALKRVHNEFSSDIRGSRIYNIYMELLDGTHRTESF